MLVTIGGSIGSGKTTLAKELAKRFGIKHVCAGEVMREMAKERRMSLLDFSRLAEKDPAIDKEIDRKQKEMAAGDCVVDGRLSAHMLKPDLAIWLDAPVEVRAERVSKRESISEKEALEGIKKREESERKRYKEIYQIDLDGRGIYDLVINTKRFDIEQTVDIVSAAIKVFNLN